MQPGDGFFHERPTVNNSGGPERTVVNIQDAPPMGAAASLFGLSWNRVSLHKEAPCPDLQTLPRYPSPI